MGFLLCNGTAAECHHGGERRGEELRVTLGARWPTKASDLSAQVTESQRERSRERTGRIQNVTAVSATVRRCVRFNL